MWYVAYTVCVAGSIGKNVVRVPCDHVGSYILSQ